MFVRKSRLEEHQFHPTLVLQIRTLIFSSAFLGSTCLPPLFIDTQLGAGSLYLPSHTLSLQKPLTFSRGTFDSGGYARNSMSRYEKTQTAISLASATSGHSLVEWVMLNATILPCCHSVEMTLQNGDGCWGRILEKALILSRLCADMTSCPCS